MIGGFGHLRQFRLGLPIRIPVLFILTARFLSAEQFVFIKPFSNLSTARNLRLTGWINAKIKRAFLNYWTWAINLPFKNVRHNFISNIFSKTPKISAPKTHFHYWTCFGYLILTNLINVWTTIALITTRNKEATKKRRKERSLKEKNLGLETSNEDSFYEISYEMKVITNGFRSLQRRSKNIDSTPSLIYFKRHFV